jgi:hypothetical protein
MYGSKGAEPRDIVAMYRGSAPCPRCNGALYRCNVALHWCSGAMYRYIGAFIRSLGAMRDSRTCSLRFNVVMYRYTVAMDWRVATFIR